MRSVGDFVFGSRYARTVGVVLNSIVGGILTNWFVADLSVGNSGMQWSRVLETGVSYWLGAFVAFFFIYTYFLYRYETDLLLWNNRDFVRAMLKRELVPAMIEATKAKIAKGKKVSLQDLEKEIEGS